MISLFIAAILLGIVFRYFSQIITFEKKIKVAREAILEKNNLDIKLNSIFSQLVYKNFSKEDPFFYSKDNTLFFHFDNRVDPDPRFCSEVLSELFLDKKNDLILKISPVGNDNKIYREEILMKTVKNLSFEFIKKTYTQTASEQKSFFSAFTSWDKEQNSIPAILKIHLKNKEDENLSFDFFLPTMQSSITYIDKEK